MFIPDDLRPDFRFDAEFFAQLTDQRHKRTLASFHLPAWELPLEWVTIIAFTLADEQLSIFTLYNCCYHYDGTVLHTRLTRAELISA